MARRGRRWRTSQRGGYVPPVSVPSVPSEGDLTLIAIYTSFPSDANVYDIPIPTGYDWIDLRYAGVTGDTADQVAYSVSVDGGTSVVTTDVNGTDATFRYCSVAVFYGVEDAGMIHMGFSAVRTMIFSPGNTRPGIVVNGRVDVLRLTTLSGENFNGVGKVWLHGIPSA